MKLELNQIECTSIRSSADESTQRIISGPSCGGVALSRGDLAGAANAVDGCVRPRSIAILENLFVKGIVSGFSVASLVVFPYSRRRRQLLLHHCASLDFCLDNLNLPPQDFFS